MNRSAQKQPRPPGNLRQRIFAWRVAQGESALENVIAARKQALFSDLHGDVLEIGPGAGSNLRFYPADAHWLGVEPNLSMHPYLLQTIHKLGWPVERFHIDPGDPGGIRLPAADASLDAVVSTHVLCSVPHPEQTLGEILRVLRPGGRFAFIEHVAAPRGSGLRVFQNLLQPAWTYFAEGCHPNRATEEAIGNAGFASVNIERFRYPEWGPVAPHIAGMAMK